MRLCCAVLPYSASCAQRPPEVRYGLVRFHTMRHGDRARYRCNPGFELIGDNYLTCLHGRWTGNVPTCQEGESAYRSLIIPYRGGSGICQGGGPWSQGSIMPGFHHSVAVLPLPFCRSAVVKFVRKFWSVTAVSSKKMRNGSGNSNGVRKRQRLTGTAKRQRKNGNGMVETGHKPRVSDGGELLLPVFILHESTVKATFNTPCELLGDGGIRRGSQRVLCTKVGGINP